MAKNKFNTFNTEEASYLLTAGKMLSDYLEVSSVFSGIEIEHFAEEWISHNLDKPGKTMEKAVWRIFLNNLIRYRKRENE